MQLLALFIQTGDTFSQIPLYIPSLTRYSGVKRNTKKPQNGPPQPTTAWAKPLDHTVKQKPKNQEVRNQNAAPIFSWTRISKSSFMQNESIRVIHYIIICADTKVLLDSAHICLISLHKGK